MIIVQQHFSHTDEQGKASMVDINEKAVSVRTAEAFARLKMRPETVLLIKENKIKKGDVLSCARIAGIMAAKKTPELIPLCHALPLEKVSVDFDFESETTLSIKTFSKCSYKTGVEMEALTAASVAALTVYDMCKAVDRAMVIQEIRLISKSGGRSGDYQFENED